MRNPDQNHKMSWPVLEQFRRADWTALGSTAASSRRAGLQPRTQTADRVVRSVCPYCAVGCGQLVYVKDEKIIDIEGDPDSPISQGCLCPKGAATFQLVTGNQRQKHVLYRRPGGKEGERIPREEAMEMVAERVKRTRDATFEEQEPPGAKHEGARVNRTLGIAHLGG